MLCAVSISEASSVLDVPSVMSPTFTNIPALKTPFRSADGDDEPPSFVAPEQTA